MFKKLLTLSAAAMVCASLYAAPGDVVEDYSIDWKYSDWNFYVMGYKPVVVDGILTSENPRGTNDYDTGTYTPNNDEDGDGLPDPSWYQYFVADGIPTAPGTTYKVTAKIKASEEVTFNLNMGWGWGDGQQIGRQITATTEWSEQEIEYPEVGGASCNLVAQPGTSTAKIEWEWIKVTHIDNAKPVEWINVLTNGDAEGDDNSCFWTKLYGVDLMNSEIETVDGSRVYAVHACAKVEQVWDNQFFITVPEEYALQTGSDVKISFRYKAAKPAKASTQIHSTATNYMWSAIGDINFTTEWQNFSKTLTPSSEMNNGRTIAFNLNELEDANDYYFDDIQWCITPTEDGWFVAGDFLDNAWDYDNSYVMTPTEDATFTTCVGTEEKPASVVRISTKRGNDNAFNSNCIKCAEVVDGEWLDYTTAGAYKINLPEEGIWIIEVDPEYNQICFTKTDHTGISSIENDANAPAVYYNMQGMQIANPVAGQLYIVKKGNKVTKTIIR